jgi:hypothetical protein
MKGLKRQLNRIKPLFMPGGKLSALRSVYDGFETFLFTPNETSASTGAHIHDANDSKRTMIIVVLALMPCFFFGMYNTGYQHWLAAGATEFPFWQLMLYGLLAVLPRVVGCYVVGLGIEFIVAQWRKEEIQEGFLVTGILIPMICPIDTPLWMILVATAFSVIFVKEVFGGTGYNILNVALVTRAFLFFAYPKQMSGSDVFVATDPICGLGSKAVDGFSGATPLGEIATATDASQVADVTSNAWQAFIGLIPGSFGETSTLCILMENHAQRHGGRSGHGRSGPCLPHHHLSRLHDDSGGPPALWRPALCHCVYGHRPRHLSAHRNGQMDLRRPGGHHRRGDSRLQQRLPRRRHARRLADERLRSADRPLRGASQRVAPPASLQSQLLTHPLSLLT